MSPAILLLLALALGLAGWLAARARAWTFKRAQPGVRLAALPSYHGWYVALWIVIPAVLFAMVWAALSPNLVLQSVLASPAAADLPSFGLQRQTMLAEHAVVLHPGPMLRGMEIAYSVADSPQSAVLQQVSNGVHVRMAVLFHLLVGAEEGAISA